jgi:hypothetical protein
VLRRWGEASHRFFDLHVRELPGEEIEEVTGDPEKVAAK